jgi:cytochrome P450
MSIRPHNYESERRPQRRDGPTARPAAFGVADGTPLRVCHYAGFAPFGFGYRRCPGEQLTIQVFEDFLRKVWRDKITFHGLNLPNPHARSC